ncbi:hypothetical protein U0C82_06785 [Fulvimarina sp. 2208YS6-2-32]|uniref:Uncharacterized protein n=1 Tax=Fulvimarina uroteuthidis TaxID=3098149 RepID=A0ABU5I1Z3_9HYPH|nr:hypothetical protein [Fulvimarina sp. 2208YS6-2-32]MDY8108849.1 hypothetical protein [Fulvimarina sp. 2208YS6-2-32]
MSNTQRFDLPAEDKERVMRLTQEVFVPHLQKAVEEARPQAPFTEVLSAASSAYADLLDMTVGREAAVKLLKSLADHLEKRPVRQTPGETRQ